MKGIILVLTALLLLAGALALTVEKRESFDFNGNSWRFEGGDTVYTNPFVSFFDGNDVREVRYGLDGKFGLNVDGKVLHGTFSKILLNVELSDEDLKTDMPDILPSNSETIPEASSEVALPSEKVPSLISDFKINQPFKVRCQCNSTIAEVPVIIVNDTALQETKAEIDLLKSENELLRQNVQSLTEQLSRVSFFLMNCKEVMALTADSLQEKKREWSWWGWFK